MCFLVIFLRRMAEAITLDPNKERIDSNVACVGDEREADIKFMCRF